MSSVDVCLNHSKMGVESVGFTMTSPLPEDVKIRGESTCAVISLLLWSFVLCSFLNIFGGGESGPHHDASDGAKSRRAYFKNARHAL